MMYARKIKKINKLAIILEIILCLANIVTQDKITKKEALKLFLRILGKIIHLNKTIIMIMMMMKMKSLLILLLLRESIANKVSETTVSKSLQTKFQ